MKMIKTLCAIGVVAASMNAGNVMAKVSAEEAARLGADLTPVGAEKAGNAEGTIPAWTGGITEPPAGYTQGQPYIDPFSDDKALFTINKANMDKYKNTLSEGQKRMLTKYDSYFMPVYQSRRSTSYPQEISDFVKKNAVTAEMIDGGNGIQGIEGVVPFPITQHPIEMIWNHFMRNRGGSFERNNIQVTPTESGDYSPVQFYEEFSTRFELTDYETSTDQNVYFYFKQIILIMNLWSHPCIQLRSKIIYCFHHGN